MKLLILMFLGVWLWLLCWPLVLLVLLLWPLVGAAKGFFKAREARGAA